MRRPCRRTNAPKASGPGGRAASAGWMTANRPCVVLPSSSTPALRNGLNHGAVCSRNHNRSEALLTDSIVILEPSTACLRCGIRLTTYGKVRNQRRDEMVAKEYTRDRG